MSASLFACPPLRWLALLFFALLAAAPTAQAQWAEALSGAPDARLYKTVIDPAGNVTVAGGFSGTLTLGATTLTSHGDRDLFVARRSAAGGWDWAVAGGGVWADTLYNLLQLPTGEVCLVGRTQGNSTFQDALGTTSLLGSKTFLATVSSGGHWTGVNGLVLTGGADLTCAALEPTSGDVLVGGRFYGPNVTIGPLTIPGTGSGVFVGRLSSGGQWRWVEPVSENNHPAIYKISSDGNGGLIVIGGFYETITFGSVVVFDPSGGYFIAHLTAGRTWQWAKVIASDGGRIIFRDHTADAAGNSYFTGMFESGIRYGGSSYASPLSSFWLSPDMFIFKLNAQGMWEWGDAVGGSSSDAGTSVCVDNAGSVYVGALISDTTYNGVRLEPVPGGVNGAVIRYDTNTGTPQATALFGGTAGAVLVSSMAMNPANGHLVVGGMFDSPTLRLGSNTLTHTGGTRIYSSFVADFSSLLRPLGTAEEAAALTQLTLSPNPAHGAVWLNVSAPLSRAAATTTAGTLLDGMGRAVRSFPLTGERTRLDIQGLAPGVYTVRVGAQTRRLVVE